MCALKGLNRLFLNVSLGVQRRMSSEGEKRMNENVETKKRGEREERRFDYAEDTNRRTAALLLVAAGQAFGPLGYGVGGHRIRLA